MNKIIVIYYSRTNNNKYLAEKVAQKLKCDIDTINPRLNLFFFLMIFSSFKKSLGIKILKHNLNEYDRVILCGPIWMGKLISPIRDFINKYRKSINKLYFVSCCGSGDTVKDEKFGHGIVFKEIEAMLGEKCVQCLAFPIGLVLPEDKQKDGDTIMKTRLSSENFTGEIEKRFESFIQNFN